MTKKLPLEAAQSTGVPFRKPEWLAMLRQLVRCYQAFESHSAAHTRTLGLTPPQFDIIVTLGNTEGMSCKDLGERTLITKGTLTGILDRLETKGLVVRRESVADRRSFMIHLTEQGEACFERIFPEHLAYMSPAFETLSSDEREQITENLSRLSRAFTGTSDRRS